MCVKTYVETSICRETDENGKYKKSVPKFKKTFSKETKELWEMLENPEEGRNIKDVYEKAQKIIESLQFLRDDIKEYSGYSDEKSDFI